MSPLTVAPQLIVPFEYAQSAAPLFQTLSGVSLRTTNYNFATQLTSIQLHDALTTPHGVVTDSVNTSRYVPELSRQPISGGSLDFHGGSGLKIIM